MKKIVVISSIVVLSCSGPKSQPEASADSTRLSDSVSQTTLNAPYTPPPELTVFGASVNDLLSKVYFPVQSCVDEPSETDSTTYSIYSSQVIEGSYADMTGGCSSAGTKIFSVQFQTDPITLEGGQEVDIGDIVYYNEYRFYNVEQNDGSVVLSNRVTGGSDCAHSGFNTVITNEYNLTDDCQTMVVESTSEGGNALPWKRRNLGFFLLADGEFKSVLNVNLEDSQSMMNFGGGPNHYFEQLYTIDILETKTLGLKDVRITKQDTGFSILYTFNGQEYVPNQ